MNSSSSSSSAHTHILRTTLENVSFLQSEGVLNDSQANEIKSHLQTALQSTLTSSSSIEPPNSSAIRSIPPPPATTSSSPIPTPTPIPTPAPTSSISSFSQARSKVPPPPPSNKPQSQSIPTPPPPEQVIALWSYQSTSKDELSFSENEIITILNKDDKDWFKGKSQATGKVGLFPSSYTENTRVARGLLNGDNSQLPPGYDDEKNGNSNGVGNGNGNSYPAVQSRFSNYGNGSGSGYGNGNPNAPVPQTEEQKIKQDKLKKIGGTVGNAAVGGFGAGIGFGLASAIF